MEPLSPTSPANVIDQAESIFVGGGNTFRLLKSLQDLGVMDGIRRRVRQGMPFIGSSAGSIVCDMLPSPPCCRPDQRATKEQMR